ncbi:DUF4035 domain-containing protein [Providencia alcalifaciens]|uniref:Minor tail T domain-containing protein n=1 Tax=Providencia alcalifaciens DSM 30120 TaxID=520999 RepID=B6XBS9_9GAMM|nr:DUF4035 domain-containing protein [Providencia alcalifaciens]ATG18031.1 DUF4035 domain-containing protein [Providencia alcalifaciens]EEB47081.1 hypothetical protein PROVALCAL_00790 [Providencia alcalifaciens DSM 30120]SQI33566.1 Uncharacterised protein [Providencia alcalifaciens]
MFFLMTLALRMGRTVDELTRTMSADELIMWMAFDRLSPIGDIRGDIQTAHIVSSLYGAQGGKLSLHDAMLRWGARDERVADDSLEEFLQSISEGGL